MVNRNTDAHYSKNVHFFTLRKTKQNGGVYLPQSRDVAVTPMMSIMQHLRHNVRLMLGSLQHSNGSFKIMKTNQAQNFAAYCIHIHNDIIL